MKQTPEEKRANQLNRTYERYKALTVGRCKNDALKEFQKLRRMQESYLDGTAFCISCGKSQHMKEMDGGHYISRTRTVTAFSPLNVWPQCKYCNQHLNGNQSEYRRGLITKVGVEAVEFLEEMQKEELTLTKWNYAVRREYYRSCIKQLGG